MSKIKITEREKAALKAARASLECKGFPETDEEGLRRVKGMSADPLCQLSNVLFEELKAQGQEQTDIWRKWRKRLREELWLLAIHISLTNQEWARSSIRKRYWYEEKEAVLQLIDEGLEEEEEV